MSFSADINIYDDSFNTAPYQTSPERYCSNAICYWRNFSMNCWWEASSNAINFWCLLQ